ncbi:HEAT repeat domain-containing protein [Pseudomonas syringae]|uniref:HEAT repeat domain-containing protein n=1 Tax=Pseudomonas syringae TaxID=317 RepID=UPI000ACBEE2B|nr:HEAT repeat domain-containing protein [Pseudomonas syringae]
MDNNKVVESLISTMKSSAYPNEVRAGAAEGLGFTGFVSARDALNDVMKSSAYPTEVRASAAKALGRSVL